MKSKLKTFILFILFIFVSNCSNDKSTENNTGSNPNSNIDTDTTLQFNTDSTLKNEDDDTDSTNIIPISDSENNNDSSSNDTANNVINDSDVIIGQKPDTDSDIYSDTDFSTDSDSTNVYDSDLGTDTDSTNWGDTDSSTDSDSEPYKKHIKVSSNRYHGNLGGIAGADLICAANFGQKYKAMISDGITRIATISNNTGDGQLDWVISPETTYVNESNETIFVTGSIALLALDNGSEVDLLNIIGSNVSNCGAWTGMNEFWVSDMDCSDWSSNLEVENGISFDFASINYTDIPSDGILSTCMYTKKLICVEQ